MVECVWKYQLAATWGINIFTLESLIEAVVKATGVTLIVIWKEKSMAFTQWLLVLPNIGDESVSP